MARSESSGGRRRTEDPGPRTQAREAALQILYALDAGNEHGDEAVTTALQRYWAHLDGPAAGRPYGDELVRAVMTTRDALDTTIRAANPTWRVERMARVDRNILRIATHEMVRETDAVAPEIAIDEAIELAKRFGGEDSAPFVNGVLDRIARNHARG